MLLLLHIVFVLIGQKYRVSGAVGVSYKPNLKMLLLLSHTAQCKLRARTTLSGILTPLSWHAIGDQINGLCKTLWVIQHSAFRHMTEWYMSARVCVCVCVCVRECVCVCIKMSMSIILVWVLLFHQRQLNIVWHAILPYSHLPCRNKVN